MILTRADFWNRLHVRSLDLFAPVLAVSSRTGGGQVIRARSFGDDLWQATVTLAPGRHVDIRERRALLMLAQQPGVRFVVSDPSYQGHSVPAGVLASVASDNRTLTVSGLPAGLQIRTGDYLSVHRHFHTVTAATAAAGNGTATVEVMPHVRHDISIGGPVALNTPSFLAQIDGIRPALFEAVIGGEASFGITQVYE